MDKNLYLLEDIIKADFSILYSQYDAKATSFVEAKLAVDHRNNYSSLNILSLNRSLKQFLRSLRFLKDIRGKHKKSLTIYSHDQYLCKLLEKLFSSIRSDIDISFQSNFNELRSARKHHRLVILLGVTYIAPKFLRKFLQNDVFLINKINTSTERKTFGTYKIFNNITELKKVIFLFIIVKRILSNKNA